MGVLFYQGNSGIKVLNKQKKLSNDVISALRFDRMNIYVETNEGDVRSSGIIKVNIPNDKSLMVIKDKFSEFMEVTEKTKGQMYDAKIDMRILRLRKTGGVKRVVDDAGNMSVTKNPSNAQHESGLMYILNDGMKTDQEINKYIKFDFDNSWQKSFRLSFDSISSFLNPKQYNFYLDSAKNKPKFLHAMTSGKVLPDSKDNWNPADLWAVKKSKEQAVSRVISKLVSDIESSKASVYDLNVVMDELFTNKDLVGISLKKISANRAKAEVIRVSKKTINETKFKNISKKYDFSCKNSYFDFFLTFNISKKDFDYRFRFRPKGASGQLNVYGEGRPLGAKVFDGAVSADLLNKMYPEQKKFKIMVDNLSVKSTTRETIRALDDKNFSAFKTHFTNNKWKLIKVADDKVSQSDYNIKRSLVLLYYVFLIETKQLPKNAKTMFMSAKKMNDFSSVHLKVH